MNDKAKIDALQTLRDALTELRPLVERGYAHEIIDTALALTTDASEQAPAANDVEVWWKRIGCTRNPGAYTGEESARDAEIAELRALLADSAADARDAARYRWLLEHYARGDGYADIDAALNDGEPEKYLSPAIDAAIASIQPTTGEKT